MIININSKTIFIGILPKKYVTKVLLLKNISRMTASFLISKIKNRFTQRRKIRLIIKCLMRKINAMYKLILRSIKLLY